MKGFRLNCSVSGISRVNRKRGEAAFKAGAASLRLRG